MSKRTGFRHLLALLMLFAGSGASAQTADESLLLTASPSGLTQLQGVVSAFDSGLGLATIDGVSVYVGNAVADLGLTIGLGDEIAVVGNFVESASLLFAVSVEFVLQRPLKTQSVAGKQSITGTGKQSTASANKTSITGTGISLQSITGTGKQSTASANKTSITGTGISLQSITGTGKQSITGTGISSESITGTGASTDSITGTGFLE
jgi:hypothetical protein